MTVELDFNENPLGTSMAVARAVAEAGAELHRYPRGLHQRTEALVAAHFGVAPGSVLLTAGVDEAVDGLLLEAGRGCCLVPGFPGYRHRAEALRIPLACLPLDDDWQPPPLGPWTREANLAILTQPNNPTGNLYSDAWLEGLLERVPAVFVDETFIDFSDRPSFLEWIGRRPAGRTGELFVFKSFSKIHGVAGLRVGALFGAEAAVARLREAQHFYPVDSLSLRFLAAALADRDFQRRTVEWVRVWRGRFAAALRRHHSLFDRVEETECNFVLARCAPPEACPALVRSVLEEGVRVADCAPLLLPGWIRVSVGGPGTLEALTAALDRVAATVVTAGAQAPPSRLGAPERRRADVAS